MSTEENKAVFRRVTEVFNTGNLAAADELFAPDYIEHLAFPRDFRSGIAGFKQFASTLRTGFPDFHYTVENMIAEGDQVAGRLTASGTHQAELFGMPATGKQATWSEIHIARFANGKLIEHWGTIDQLGMFQQLGVIPPPGQAG